MGPQDNIKDGNIYWGRSNVILSMAMLAEAEPNLFANVTGAMLRYLLELQRRITSPEYAPLAGWAQQRWQDIALGVQWVLENAPQSHIQELTALLVTLHQQGSDWESWFTTLSGAAGSHNVNVAQVGTSGVLTPCGCKEELIQMLQALKSAAIMYISTGNSTMHMLSQQRMHNLDEKVGLPTGEHPFAVKRSFVLLTTNRPSGGVGMFNGDEIIPDPFTRNPSRGIEVWTLVFLRACLKIG